MQKLLEAPDAVLVSDGGEFGQWAQACLEAPARIINGPAGAIGSALPFAAAAKLARPDATVVAMLGDGTFGFHMSEIDTAVRCGLDYIAVIGNDATWNAEYQIQLRAYGKARAKGCVHAESDPVQLDFEFVVSVGPARQQFRADKNRPSRINLRDRNLDVVLLLPMRRNLPAVDHDGIATVPADESVTDVQPGTSGPHEFPSAGGEYQAPATAQKP